MCCAMGQCFVTASQAAAGAGLQSGSAAAPPEALDELHRWRHQRGGYCCCGLLAAGRCRPPALRRHLSGLPHVQCPAAELSCVCRHPRWGCGWCCGCGCGCVWFWRCHRRGHVRGGGSGGGCGRGCSPRRHVAPPVTLHSGHERRRCHQESLHRGTRLPTTHTYSIRDVRYQQGCVCVRSTQHVC